jgi:CelD/BcsL family acetyltransferase involved in cellulose biosynthesis
MTQVDSQQTLETTDMQVLGEIHDYKVFKVSSPSIIEADWREIEEQNTACIYQHYDWVRICCETLEKDHTVFIVMGKNESGAQFILPMAVENGFIKTLRWIGNTHSNICSGIYSKDFLKTSTPEFLKDLFKLIGSGIGGLCYAQLNNQPKELAGFSNPLLHLPQQQSVNKMYDMNLTHGMDAILDAGNGKRKRKLWRKQNRIAESQGGFEFVIPKTDAEKKEAVEEFFVMKAQRFKDMGIKDVFADANAKQFVFDQALAPEKNGITLYEIYLLKVGGKTRAMYAVGIYGKRCQAYVNAVSYDEFSSNSPGEMLIYMMVEHLVNKGYETLDLGVGNERYKRSWCPNEYGLFSTIMPLTGASIPFVKAVQMKNSTKRALRNNDAIWSRLKKIRKLKASIFNSN